MLSVGKKNTFFAFNSNKETRVSLGVVVHAFNTSPGEQSQDNLCDFEVSLVYIKNFRPGRYIMRSHLKNSVSGV